MIKLGLLILLFSFSLFVSAQNDIDVLHYRFEISLNDNNDTIRGQSTIRLLLKNSSREIKIDLKKSDVAGKGMMIDGPITLKNLSSLRLNHKHVNDVLYINLPVFDTVLSHIEITIPYKGVPADGLIISKNKFGKRTFFADNWPNRAHNWLPCVDNPSDKASVEFIVTAPNHYQVISNGIQVEETNLPGNMKLTHYKEDLPLPTKIMVIGVAEFAVNHEGMVNNCIPVTSWVFPENKTNGFDDYAIADDILKFFIDYIGPYPYQKLANIQSKTIFGGMENASAIFYSENSVTGLNDQEALIAHEIIHQWFGNMATEKSFAHLWLSEGFATYFTHLYLESKYGPDTLVKRMRKDRSEIIGFLQSRPKPVVDMTTDYMSLLNENSYQRGSWVLHMLRTQLGDTIFKKAVRKYYATYTGKNADTRDLQRVFEEVSGKNLEKFFEQWLFTAEIPDLTIRWTHNPGKKEITLNVKQSQPSVFEFPVKIVVVSDSGAAVPYDSMIDKREQVIVLPFPGNPQSVGFEIDYVKPLLIKVDSKKTN